MVVKTCRWHVDGRSGTVTVRVKASRFESFIAVYVCATRKILGDVDAAVGFTRQEKSLD